MTGVGLSKLEELHYLSLKSPAISNDGLGVIGSLPELGYLALTLGEHVDTEAAHLGKVPIRARASLRSLPGRPGRFDVDLEPGTLEHKRPALGGRRAQNPLQDHGDVARAMLGDVLEHLSIVLAVELRECGTRDPPSRTSSMTGSPAGPSIGTRSWGMASTESGTATLRPGTRIVACFITGQYS